MGGSREKIVARAHIIDKKPRSEGGNANEDNQKNRTEKIEHERVVALFDVGPARIDRLAILLAHTASPDKTSAVERTPAPHVAALRAAFRVPVLPRHVRRIVAELRRASNDAAATLPDKVSQKRILAHCLRRLLSRRKDTRLFVTHYHGDIFDEEPHAKRNDHDGRQA